LPYLFSFLPAAEHITSRAGTLAGEDRAFTYMVLFQNATELRRQEDSLGSYYLVTMQQGKVVSKKFKMCTTLMVRLMLHKASTSRNSIFT
jgi:hypothetical protein